jgi:2-polyprenyl-3-methyl-5-hydroxy-6-metoxy-1,4-benzoquinol methylase
MDVRAKLATGALKPVKKKNPIAPAEGASERFLPGMSGAVKNEHLHRYLFASQLAPKGTVLDAASGEGYGSSILAEQAKEVVGVDLDSTAVRAATDKYTKTNLRFIVSTVEALPFLDNHFDLIVSFETIEHVDSINLVLDEFKRVLKNHGKLIISTPDKLYYPSGNPFHRHEMHESEFRSKLSDRFKHVKMYKQRSVAGSLIQPVKSGNELSGSFVHSSVVKGADPSELQCAHYMIAICSTEPLTPVAYGLFDNPQEAERVWCIHDYLYPDSQIKLNDLRSKINRWRMSWWGRCGAFTLRCLQRIRFGRG